MREWPNIASAACNSRRLVNRTVDREIKGGAHTWFHQEWFLGSHAGVFLLVERRLDLQIYWGWTAGTTAVMWGVTSHLRILGWVGHAGTLISAII